MKYRVTYSTHMGNTNSSWDDARRTLKLAREWSEDGKVVTVLDQNDRRWSLDDFVDFVLSGDAEE